MTGLTTLRNLSGLPDEPAGLKNSALIMIDCQNTYREGVMKLDGVEEALAEASRLLARARDLGIPVIHIQHDAGAGTPYDLNAHVGAIADAVAPLGDEPVIVKNYPDSFVKTGLDDLLRARGIENLVLAGFMTHMCVNSTARGAFNLGYKPTIVAKATATRPLPTADGRIVSSDMLQEASLAGVRDLFAVVVQGAADLKD